MKTNSDPCVINDPLERKDFVKGAKFGSIFDDIKADFQNPT
jgi:hypothetical protein